VLGASDVRVSPASDEERCGVRRLARDITNTSKPISAASIRTMTAMATGRDIWEPFGSLSVTEASIERNPQPTVDFA
jgi:hypothetical protein